MAMPYDNAGARWDQQYEGRPQVEDVRLGGFSGGTHPDDGMFQWDATHIQARLRGSTPNQPLSFARPATPPRAWQEESRQFQPSASAASLLSSADVSKRFAETKQTGGFTLDLTGMAFARKFLFVGLVIFAPPFWAMMRVGLDPQAAYWLPYSLIIATALMLPFISVLVFVANSMRGRPVQLVMGVGFLVSCVLLMLTSNHALRKAHALENILSATDCDTWADKRELELEWQAAQTFYASCMSATANATGTPYAQVVRNYVITDCGLYVEKLQKHPLWDYLGELEAKLFCGGWCRVGPALWTRQSPAAKDSCSTSVAQILSSRIQPLLTQVAVYSMLVLFALSLLFVTSEPLLAQARLKI